MFCPLCGCEAPRCAVLFPKCGRASRRGTERQPGQLLAKAGRSCQRSPEAHQLSRLSGRTVRGTGESSLPSWLPSQPSRSTVCSTQRKSSEEPPKPKMGTESCLRVTGGVRPGEEDRIIESERPVAGLRGRLYLFS